ncbi:MAG: Rrf2 family transcriptional regulator [Treponema sp.]|jgi:Rrf2 family protein|nr:Rrf2 family transcriptional regulator [Treponema sp.]
MRISTKGRYSLEALLYLALLPPGGYISTRVIAEGTGISEGYLEQLFIPLRKAGILQGIRGPQGGYKPGRSLEQISAGDILQAVEGPLEIAACATSSTKAPCPRESSCESIGLWNELYREITGCVGAITLQELAETCRTMDTLEYTI